MAHLPIATNAYDSKGITVVRMTRSQRKEVLQSRRKVDLSKAVAGLQGTVLSNMFTVDSIFELLVEKGIPTGEEVRDRVKKLKDEVPPAKWIQ